MAGRMREEEEEEEEEYDDKSGPGTSGLQVCRGECNRSIAEAEVVAGEGNRRNGLRCVTGALHDGVGRPAAGAVQIPGARESNHQTLVPPGDWLLHAVRARPATGSFRPGQSRGFEHLLSLAQCSIADNVIGALIPRLGVRHRAMEHH
jgi:hypothetical protein